jgi:hypothetical protein
MARYLLQLGKETGSGAPWSDALGLIEDVFARLGPLGVSFNPSALTQGVAEAVHRIPGVAKLHAPMLEVLLDLAGLEYDASARLLSLQPILPPDWPEIGVEQRFACGRIGYRFQAFAQRRPSHRITLEAELRLPVKLDVAVTCPEMTEVGNWRASPPGPPPVFDKKRKTLSWTIDLEPENDQWEWSWG